MGDIVEEPRLRSHIRNLLLDYALTHLTTDYVQFTQDAVAQLLSDLIEIPTDDPNSLFLPTDPFDTLSRRYGLGNLELKEERFNTTLESLSYIKQILKTQPGRSKSERVWYEDEWEPNLSIYQPMSSVLTTRSIRLTPKLGSNDLIKSLPSSFSAFLESQSIKKVGIVEQKDPYIKLEDALNLRLPLPVETHTAILALFNSTKALSRPGPTYVNQYTDIFRKHSPPPTPKRESPFTPIFPRNRLPRCGSRPTDPHPSGFDDISVLASIAIPKIKVEDDDGDLYKEHMVVVDGWQTYNTSSPSCLSTPTSSQGHDQLDELFMHSSPNTDPAPIQVLMEAKMDEVLMPRSERIGGARNPVKSIGDGKNLTAFLLPLLPKPKTPKPLAPESESVRSSPEPSASMLGQPPSDTESGSLRSARPPEDDEDDFSVVVKKLYETTQKQDPRSFILMERLDEKAALFMDVPVLPSPNEHAPSGLLLPTKFQALLTPLKCNKEQTKTSTMHEFLRKAKGIQSLVMELSWIPFKLQTRLPTHDEVAGVSMLLGPDHLEHCLSQDQLDDEIKSLLIKACVNAVYPHANDPDGCATDYQEKDHWKDLDDTPFGTTSNGFSSDIARCEIILTREERRRLAGIANQDPNDVIIEDLDVDGTDHVSDSDRSNQDGEDIHRPAKRVRLELDGDDRVIDDSGISFQSGDPRIDVFRDQMLVDSAPFSLPPSDDIPSLSFDADKENICPYLEPDYRYERRHQPDHAGYSYEMQEDRPFSHNDTQFENGEPLAPLQDGFENERGGFLPLSFDSHWAVSAQPSQTQIDRELKSGESSLDRSFLMLEDAVHRDTLPDRPISFHSDPLPKPDSPAQSLTLPSHSAGIAAFAELRAKKFLYPDLLPTISATVSAPASNPTPKSSMPHVIPEEVYDRNTLRIPSPWNLPSTLHRYMASMNVVQKQILVRSLRSRACAVNLVERDALPGVDIIMDPHTAIIFAPLFALPSQCEALTSKISQQSWRYSRLLVIFEGYPASHSYKSDLSTETPLFAYSPPILKAVKKLRRDLGIAEAYEKKQAASSVQFAFADTVDEASLFVRHFGDLAESKDETQGAIWGDREWLDDEPSEHEGDLASVDGMNPFAAFVILCQINLQDFLDLIPDARIEMFGHFIGIDRIALFNDILECRVQAMDSSDLVNETETE